MYIRAVAFYVVWACCALGAARGVEAAQNEGGRIEGRILRENGAPVEGATLLLIETQSSVITGRSGEFSLDGVPAGVYSLAVSLGPHATTVTGVMVATRQTTIITEVVDWEIGFTDTLTVLSTARRPERLVSAPAAVTRLTDAEIAEKAATGQLPKLVEFVPGAQLTQGGVYDYNLNTRGFNSSLNRRVAVLIDGRNPAASFFEAQEWAAIGFPLDDLASLELVRGPSAALYGANASSGILNMITKAPRFSRGGVVRVTLGQLDTTNVDFRWSGQLHDQWFAKVVGGIRRSGDFFISRKGAAEYTVPCAPGRTGNCLPQDAVVPPRIDDNDVFFGAVRADRYWSSGIVLTMEGGVADVAGPVVQTGVGRTQVTDVQRPWARLNLNANHANVFVAYTGRDAPGQLALASDTNSTLRSHTVQFEGQTNRSFRQGRVQVVVGASAAIERIDSFDEQLQRQSLVFEPLKSNQQALFAQVEWTVIGPLRLAVASRGDFSSLHDFQFSPKGSAVYTFAQNHHVRVTYNEAFQVPNASEFFLQADAAAPVNLGALEAFCAPVGVDCGFGSTRVLAVGNVDLELEQTRTVEAGYKGLVGGRALLTFDYYRSRSSNFISDLLPQLGTPLGRINSNFGPWEGPAGLPANVTAQVRAAAPASLSNNLDGSNILAVVSYTNFGRVDTQGADLAFDYVLPGGWRGAASYSWFDYELRNPIPGLDSMILPNTPDHTGTVGFGYARASVDAMFAMRWVDAFRWSVGPFQGDVESYATADVTANYRVVEHVTLGLNVANVFDRRHWETFGGDVLRRRALVSVGYLW